MSAKGITSAVSTILFIALAVTVATSTIYFVKDIQDNENVRVTAKLDRDLEDMSVISASDIRRCRDEQDQQEFFSRITGASQVVLVGNHPEILVDYEEGGQDFITFMDIEMNAGTEFTTYGPLTSILFRLLDYSAMLEIVGHPRFVFDSENDISSTYLIADGTVYEYVTKDCGAHTYIIGEREVSPTLQANIIASYPPLVDGEGDDWWVQSVVETMMFESEEDMLDDIQQKIASASESVVFVGNTPTSLSDDGTLDEMELALDRNVAVEAIGPITAELIAVVGPTRIASLLWKGMQIDDTDGNVTDPEDDLGMTPCASGCHDVAYVVIDGDSYKYITGSPVYTKVIPGEKPVISPAASGLHPLTEAALDDLVDGTDDYVFSHQPDTSCVGGNCEFLGTAGLASEFDVTVEATKADPFNSDSTYNLKIAESSLAKGNSAQYIVESKKKAKVRSFKENVKTKAEAGDVEAVYVVIDADEAKGFLNKPFGDAIAEISDDVPVTVVIACDGR